jgi:hypothetical protein
MKVRLRGKYWELTRTKNLRSRGDIDNPDVKSKKIRVSTKIEDETEEMLEVIIHECLHGLFWDISEEAITDSAQDLAKILYELGARIHLE